jgi:hypothetical protein
MPENSKDQQGNLTYGIQGKASNVEVITEMLNLAGATTGEGSTSEVKYLQQAIESLALLSVGQSVTVRNTGSSVARRHAGKSGIVIGVQYDMLALSGIMLRVRSTDKHGAQSEFYCEPQELTRTSESKL